MTYDCKGYNYYENVGRCFQDNSMYPMSLLRACYQCYAGSIHQFSTKKSTHLLDTILKFHFYTNTRINQQAIMV